MRTYFDCIPCFLRQSLDSVRMTTASEEVHEKLIRAVMWTLVGMDLRQSPPVMAQRIHRLVRELAGENDPYRAAKDRSNRLALGLYPDLQRRIGSSSDSLALAVRLVIGGNVIDMGVNSRLTEDQIHQAIEQAVDDPLDADLPAFRQEILKAQSILYLADNAGEIVLDRLLIEQLPPEKVTLVVRGAPVINDATLADAEAAGLTDLVTVIDNGSDAPGTIIEDCSGAFRRSFAQADLVIAKGQGNYETLSEVDKNIFFILKAKCPVIARDLDVEVGSLVLRRSEAAQAERGDSYATR